jgi:hypothetical protein
MLVVKKILWLGQTKKIIASQANFQKPIMFQNFSKKKKKEVYL